VKSKELVGGRDKDLQLAQI